MGNIEGFLGSIKNQAIHIAGEYEFTVSLSYIVLWFSSVAISRWVVDVGSKSEKKKKAYSDCLLTCANPYEIQVNWKAFKNISTAPDNRNLLNYLRSRFIHVKHALSYQNFICITILNNRTGNFSYQTDFIIIWKLMKRKCLFCIINYYCKCLNKISTTRLALQIRKLPWATQMNCFNIFFSACRLFRHSLML